MQDVYGFSPATVDWELFSQSEEGAVVMVHLPESADFDAITDKLESAGYAEPDSDDRHLGGRRRAARRRSAGSRPSSPIWSSTRTAA